MGLGLWQVQRLAWKSDLIARVDARVAAAPVPAPGPADWAGLTADNAEYRRVSVTGDYVPDSDVLVQAVTERGAGFWVMTPLVTRQGWPVLVNRGFVAADRRDDRPLPAGPQTVTGLLRLSQPDGAFLRANDPEAGRWYSRDTQAIAATLGLTDAAPYFIDADRAGEGQPIGGLTVTAFRNSHLSYALTWFAMAGGLVVLTAYALRG
ncbi:SURF1 family protein [Paracoccus sp. YIM 132242]|uniref:SURF1-like protein n=2 Tax=Paracoccus lichenicola TaxID=2665644 RepID=A0A6L6HMJ1_9RHOB|nr:SURF1 family protein [Paracoccus lichenicola]